MTSAHPVDFFNLFFDQDVKKLIHAQSTLYAEQYISRNKEYLSQHPNARPNDWKRKPMTLKEVDVIVALLIGMGIVGYPTLR